MISTSKAAIASLLACILLLAISRPAKADNLNDIGFQIAATAVVIGVVVGVGVYLLVRKGPSITGCAVSVGNGAGPGFQLKNEGDQQIYLLAGQLGNIRAGERVRVYGKKHGRDKNNRQFLVKRLPKELGSCNAVPATP